MDVRCDESTCCVVLREKCDLGKKKPIREAYADRWVRERCRVAKNKNATR